MAQPGFLRRLGENILGNVLSVVIMGSFGGAAVVTGLFVIALPRRFHWIGGPAQVLLSVGVFMIVFASALSLLPRWWRPKGPFGKMFGTAPLMMGFSEERNKQVFMRAPRLRDECEKVAKQLYTFVDKERTKLPVPPSNAAGQEDSPERIKFNADMQAYLQRFTTLYHNAWRRKVEPLFVDARAMFFGPVPATSRFMEGRSLHPEEVYRIAVALDRLSQNIPSSYAEAFHEARVERLRRLRQDGLTLSSDLGQFLIERHQAGVALQRQPTVSAETPQGEGVPHTASEAYSQWQQSVNFSGETEALFAARFGGLVVDVVQRLNGFGLSDESLDRMLGWGPAGLRISSYDIGGLAGTIAALCHQIPYD